MQIAQALLYELFGTQIIRASHFLVGVTLIGLNVTTHDHEMMFE